MDNSLKKELKQKCILELPKHTEKKNDISLLKYACDIIEQKANKKYKLDKKAILMEAFDLCFGKMNNEDKNTLNKNVEYICDSGVLKRAGVLVRTYRCIKSIFN